MWTKGQHGEHLSACNVACLDFRNPEKHGRRLEVLKLLYCRRKTLGIVWRLPIPPFALVPPAACKEITSGMCALFLLISLYMIVHWMRLLNATAQAPWLQPLGYYEANRHNQVNTPT